MIGRIQKWYRVKYAGISERKFSDFSSQFLDKESEQQIKRLPRHVFNMSRNDKIVYRIAYSVYRITLR